MALYRKKPVVIEAWRWLFDRHQDIAPTWVDDALGVWPEVGGLDPQLAHPGGPRIAIATLDAVAFAFPGDWIVRGVKGELYPCKPDIFAKTYEAVED